MISNTKLSKTMIFKNVRLIDRIAPNRDGAIAQREFPASFRPRTPRFRTWTKTPIRERLDLVPKEKIGD